MASLSRVEILRALAAGTIKAEEAEQLLAAGEQRKLTVKVSAKGAVQVNGLGRFPTTLYKDQWLRILNMADEIRQFIEDNKDSLTTKAQAGEEAAA